MGRGARFIRLGHGLAEQIERGGDAALVQRDDGVAGGRDGFTGHESRRELLGQAIVADKAEDPLLVREIEE